METNLKAIAQEMINTLMAGEGIGGMDSCDLHPSDVVETPVGEKTSFTMNRWVDRDAGPASRIVYEVTVVARVERIDE